MGSSYAVDLEKKECTCRMWQVNGYGCVHSVATISFLNRPMEPFVDPLLLGNFFINTYKYPILPMNGSDMWPTTEFTPPLPPMKRRMPGRPQVKRRRSASEGRGTKISKVGKRVLCGNCKQPGHNKATCKEICKPVKLNVKRKVNMEHGSSSGVNKDVEDDGAKKKQKVQCERSVTDKSRKREQGEPSVPKKRGRKRKSVTTCKKNSGKKVATQGPNRKYGTRSSKKMVQSQATGIDADQQQAQALQIVEAFHGIHLDAFEPQAQQDDAVQHQAQQDDAVQHQAQQDDAVQQDDVVQHQAQAQQVFAFQGQTQPHLQQKRLKRSARIVKMKLAKKVFGKNGEGDSGKTPMELD